jgi:hypothetical protein
MPATANFALPYPGALDEPCDFAQDWCAFTDATSTVLAGLQAVADRTNPAVPVGKMELNTLTTIVKGSTVPFEAVTVNNAGFVDFDASNTTMTINRPGRYVIIFNAFMSTTGIALSRFLPVINANSVGISVQDELDLATTSVAFVSNAFYSTTTAPFTINVSIDDSSVATTVTIQRAILSVFWHADGAAP